MRSKMLPSLLAVVSVMLLALSCRKSIPVTPPNNLQRDTLPPANPVTIDSSFYLLTSSDSTLLPGTLLLDMNSDKTGALFILDQRGSIIKEKKLNTLVDNFQKWVFNGQTMYSYFQTDGTYMINGILGTELGYEMICDSNLNVLDTVKLLPYGIINTNIQDKVDVHEFILLGPDHYICETYYVESPTNIPDSLHPVQGIQVISCIIQEVNNGQVVFQWDGSQYPELYASSVQNNGFNDSTTGPLDFMHLNSICVDSTDNNLIVSFRHLDEIIKISRQTGQIIWRLGGSNSDFAQTPDELFLRQHYVRKIPGTNTLLFLDNGLAGVRPYSRILEFQLNENAKTITGFNAYVIPDLFVQFAGSVKKEGNYYFIGGGEANYAAEINYTTGQELLRINQKYPSYRALKY